MYWRVLYAMDGHNPLLSMHLLEDVRTAELQNAKMGICSELQNRTSDATKDLIQNEKTHTDKHGKSLI